MNLSAFLLLAFALSWGVWWPAAVYGFGGFWAVAAGGCGPSLAAVLLAARHGRAELGALLRPLLKWRVGIGWYAFALLFTAAIGLAALAIARGAGGSVRPLPASADLMLLPSVFAFVLVFSALGEEIGWRGFALPRLLEEMPPVPASLLLGAILGVWNLPLFYMAGTVQASLPFLLFLFQILAASILYTWLWRGTGGSLLLVMLFHTGWNVTFWALPLLPADTSEPLLPLWIAVALLWTVAAMLSGRLAKGTG